MKKLLLLLILFVSFSASAQRFPSVDSLKTYILRYVKNSATESFTNLRMQNVVYGLAEFLGSGGTGVDSIWVSSSATKDTIKYRKSSTNYVAGILDKVSGKLNITDTSSMLANYIRRQELRDTADAIRTTVNGKQGALTLTTTGSSGASTLTGNTLNIPQYSGGSGTEGFVYLSEQGIISDADISFFSRNFGTNQTAAIQAVLDLAVTYKKLTVYWDVKASVTGLNIRKNTTIIASPSCGAILRDNSNRPLLVNYNYQNSSISKQDSNISIIGGIWNANGYYHSGELITYNQLRHDTTKYWVVTCLSFGGVDNVIIKDAQFIQSPGWTTYMHNVSDVLIDNCVADCGLPAAGYEAGFDGFHFNGKVRGLTIKNSTLRGMSDDAIALNADEVPIVYPDVITYLGGQVYGSIEDVVIDNVFLDNCYGFGIRLLSGSSRMDRISISNVHGLTHNYWFVADNLTNQTIDSAGNGNIGTVSIRDIDVSVLSGANIENSYAGLGCKIESISFDNYKRRDFSNSYSMIAVRSPASINKLSIKGIEQYNISTSPFGASVLKMRGGLINNLLISDLYVENVISETDSAIVLVSGGEVKNIAANNFIVNQYAKVIHHTGGVLNYINASNIFHKADSFDSSFVTTSTVTDLNVSGYTGRGVANGIFTAKRGDAFLFDRGLPLYTGGTLVFADFNSPLNGDITGTIPAPTGTNAWTRINLPIASGTMGVSSTDGKLRKLSGLDALYTIEVGFSQVSSSVKVITPNSGGTDQSMLFISYSDENNYLRVETLNGRIYQSVGGVFTELYAGSGTSVANDVIKITRIGTTVSSYRNGVLLGSGTCSSSLTGTKVAVFFYRDAISELDDLTITN